jgi:hypothetical protein
MYQHVSVGEKSEIIIVTIVKVMAEDDVFCWASL